MSTSLKKRTFRLSGLCIRTPRRFSSRNSKGNTGDIERHDVATYVIANFQNLLLLLITVALQGGIKRPRAGSDVFAITERDKYTREIHYSRPRKASKPILCDFYTCTSADDLLGRFHIMTFSLTVKASGKKIYLTS